MTDALSTVPDDTGVFYLNPPGVLSAGQSEYHPEGGKVSEQDIPPSARSDFQENIRTQQSRTEAEERQYLQRRQQEAQRLREIEGQRPKIPTEKLVGPAPDAREYQKDSMAFASSMAMLGALMAKGGRMSGANALSAFGGALKGWQEGNLEAYTNAVDKWKHETERTIENNRQLMQKYQLVMDNYRLNIDQQRAAMEEIAVQNHDQMAYNVLKVGNMTAMAQLQDQRWNWTNGPQGLENTYNTLKAKHETEVVKLQDLALQYGPYISQVDQFVHKDGTPWTNQEKMMARQIVQNFSPNIPGTTSYTGRGGLSGLHLSQVNQIRDQLTRELGREPTIEEVNDKLAERAATVTESRTIAARGGQMAPTVEESKSIVPNVWEAAKKSAGRGNAVWSAANARWEVTKGDEDFAYFVAQINSINHLYAQVLSRTGRGTVHDLLLQGQNLNPSMPLSSIKGSLRAMLTDIDVAKGAPARARAKDTTVSDKEAKARRELGMDDGGGSKGGSDLSTMSDEEIKRGAGL